MQKIFGSLIAIIGLLYACNNERPVDTSTIPVEEETKNEHPTNEISPLHEVSLVVLGTVQDAGSPQINCHQACCEPLHITNDNSRKVVSLGLVDPVNNEKFLFEASPDMTSQLALLHQYAGFGDDTPNGIFLTHAHIGHYTGLMYLGKEAMNAQNVPIYAMPRFYEFLKNNGPWSQLVSDQNIELFQIFEEQKILLNNQITVTPFIVPHRDEFSETVGYRIQGPTKKALFIPDIDKWSKWDNKIEEVIIGYDYAFIDATFFSGEELPNRDISEIPHPTVEESMKIFEHLTAEEKGHIYFIHFNHTNPLLDSNSQAYSQVIKNGFNIAHIGAVFSL